MKVLFITNYPSPYRVEFFNQLGKRVDLTVVFDENINNVIDKKLRDAAWFRADYRSFKAIFLRKKRSLTKHHINTNVCDVIREGYDFIIMGGYAEPTFVYAIEYMKLHRVPFIIEIDGGLIKNDSIFKYLLKKHLISSAGGWISSGRISDQYLMHYGADERSIYHYPFSSLTDEDLRKAGETTSEEKQKQKRALKLTEKHVALCVGQFIHRKGIDILLEAAKQLDNDIGIYIVGGEPTEEYREIKEINHLNNCHFVGFKRKEELANYYKAADVLVMPTREDIWGLVVNEALSYGLPVISTDRCVAALELVKDGKNGWIVPVENPKALAEAIEDALKGNAIERANYAKNSIREYTIEGMVEAHLEIFGKLMKPLKQEV